MTPAGDAGAAGAPGARRARLRRILRASPWWIAAFAAVVRIAAWAGGRSLWLDESYVGENLVDLGWEELLGALRHRQTAPPLWLLMEKALGTVLAMEERVLRIPALLGGIAAVFLVIPLARRTLRPAAVPAATLLAAVSATGIYYSQDLKPYATDMALATAALLVGTRLLRSVPGAAGTAALAVGGAVAVWFSFPMAFVLAGLGTTAMAAAAARRDGAGAIRLGVAGAAWVAALGGLYAFSGERASGDGFLQSFWHKAFPPLAGDPLVAAAWIRDRLPDTMADAAGLRHGAVPALLFLVGVWSLGRRSPGALALIVAPAVWTFIAAAARLYPFDGRVVLFLTPCALLPAAEGLAALRGRAGMPRRLPGVVLLVLVTGWGVANAVALSFRPPERQEIRPVLRELASRIQPGDVVYVHFGSAPSWRFYRQRLGLAHVEPHIGPRGRGNMEIHREDVRRFVGTPRMWVVLSHWWWHDSGDERGAILGHLEEFGRRLGEWRWTGAELHLFDMTSPTPDRGRRRRRPSIPSPPVEDAGPEADAPAAAAAGAPPGDDAAGVEGADGPANPR